MVDGKNDGVTDGNEDCSIDCKEDGALRHMPRKEWIYIHRLLCLYKRKSELQRICADGVVVWRLMITLRVNHQQGRWNATLRWLLCFTNCGWEIVIVVCCCVYRRWDVRYYLGIMEDTHRKRSSLDELIVIDSFGIELCFIWYVWYCLKNWRHTLMELNVYVEKVVDWMSSEIVVGCWCCWDFYLLRLLGNYY